MNVSSELPAGENQQLLNKSAGANNLATRGSNTQAGGSNGDKERPAGTSTNTSLKRLACDDCRERKVRCDRQHPSCGRCARLGNNCNYSGPSKQAALKVDWPQLLLTLHSRLSEFLPLKINCDSVYCSLTQSM